jgi:hypothetical protein
MLILGFCASLRGSALLALAVAMQRLPRPLDVTGLLVSPAGAAGARQS